MFGNKKDVRYIIFHGQTLQHLSYDEGKFIETIQHIKPYKGKTVFLLGAPYINTFLHETTHLKRNELQTADQLILPFSPSPSEHRSISSVHLGYKKSLTLHSHLTTKGEQQVKQLKKIFHFPTWYPLVEFLTEKYVQIQSEKSPLLLFSEEMLLLKYHNRTFSIQHIPHWNTFAKHHSFQNVVNSHFQQEKNLFSSHVINLRENDLSFSKENFKNSFLSELLFPKKQSLLGSKKFLKKKFQPFSKLKALFSPLHLLTTTLSLLVIWTASLYFSIYHEKNEKKDLTQQLRHLTQTAKKNEKSFELKRKTLEIEAYMNSLQKLNLQPQKFLKKIEQALPLHAWVSKVELNLLSNQVDIIGPTSLKVDLVLKNLEKKFKSIRLLSSQSVQAEDRQLTLYSIYLQDPHDQ